MTPKEKAKELVKKFGGKLNAIKCVDEIIKSFEFCGLQEDEWDIDYSFTIKEYWQEVKQEITHL
jgi:hypothetical protein